MRPLSTNDFSRMVLVVEDSFFDECNLISNTQSFDSTYGSEILTPVVTSGVSCGFQSGRTLDKNKENLFQTQVAALLRLPKDTVISGIDEIEMTKKNLVTIESETYKIEGEPLLGKTCIVVGLKRVS